MEANAQMNESSVDSTAESLLEKKLLAGAFVFVLLATIAYVAFTGLIVFMGDSFLLANRAKHVADQFNLNLNNGMAPLIYPPLYPVVLAFAYRFDDPATIFRMTLAIHALLTALQVVPLFYLLRGYGRLEMRAAAGMAAALALAPASLPYSSIMLTEVLFCPLVLWLSFYVYRAWHEGEFNRYVGIGLVAAACAMTRSAAFTVLVALAGAGLMLLRHCRDNEEQSRLIKRGFGTAALAFVALYGGWSVVEMSLVRYEAFVPQFEISHVTEVVADGAKLDLHANWLANCFFYLLSAPLSLAGAFVLVYFVRRPRALRSDPLATFFLLTMLVSAVVIALVPKEYHGGKELTWNRYVMPYVVFASLIAIRYRDRFNRSYLFLATLVLAITVLSFRPANLACHFTDALAIFGGQRLFKSADVLLNLAYFAFTVAGGWLWLRGPRGRTAALALTASVWLLTHVTAAAVYRNGGDLNISNYSGAGKIAYEIAAKNPGTKVFYDPGFGSKDSFGSLRVLYYWPNLEIEKLAPKAIRSQSIPAGAKLLYFTVTSIPGHAPVAWDRGDIKLYQFDERQLAALRESRELPAAPARFVEGANFPATEIGEKEGLKFPVRWLRQGTEFFVESELEEVDLHLDLATFQAQRTVYLEVNGQPSKETYTVGGDFWTTPETEARFRIRLNPGRNQVRVLAKEPPSKLSDGREVTFLMIGDARATKPAAAK